MSPSYAQYVSTRRTPVSEPIPGKVMAQNNSGGWSFAVDDWTRLDRWLVCGAQDGSYYVTERKLTQENAACVRRCLALDAARTVNRIVEISEGGKAPKNEPAIFALALCATWAHAPAPRFPAEPSLKPGYSPEFAFAHNHKLAVLRNAQAKATRAWNAKDTPAHREARRLACNAVPRVCRTPTHLTTWVEAMRERSGGGALFREAICAFYLSKGDRELAYLCSKYQSRNGWSHRDLLRLAHLKPPADGSDRAIILNWCARGWPGVGDKPHPSPALLPIWAMEKAKRATDKHEVVRLIRDFDLVRECIPTQFLTEPEVWEALLEKMPLTALVRNLATMTRVGRLAPLSSAVKKVTDALSDQERIVRSRLHPIALLTALKTYAAGKGDKSKHTWSPVGPVVDALDAAFYLAFKAVEPTGKRHLLSLDVSGSMGWGQIAGVAGLTPRIASAAMALVTANVEPQYHFCAFSHTMVPLSITPTMRLDNAIRAASELPFGATDCSLPMRYALHYKLPVDVFIVYTDSECNSGMHASQALVEYRQKTGIPAKLAVVGMTATECTVCDPNDAGSLNAVGFSTDTPQVLANFAIGA